MSLVLKNKGVQSWQTTVNCVEKQIVLYVAV